MSTPIPVRDKAQSRRRSQVAQACIRCQDRKIKCDGRQPRCMSCEAVPVPCYYAPRKRDILMHELIRERRKASIYEETLMSLRNCTSPEGVGMIDRVLAGFQPPSPASDPSSTSSTCTNPSPPDTKPLPDTVLEVPGQPFFMSMQNRFARAQKFPPSMTTFSRDFDIHVIIMAVTRGWQYTRQCFVLDKQWDPIEETDFEFIGRRSLAERFAFLWILRCNLKALSNGAPTPPQKAAAEESPEGTDGAAGVLVPPWLSPTEVQQSIPHPGLVDYCPWPALRARMVTRQGGFCTDRFMKPYMQKIRFRWTFSWEEATAPSQDGLMVGFSQEFSRRLMDISCWAFERDFAAMFPDIESDVVWYDPKPVAYPGTAGSVEKGEKALEADEAETLSHE